MQSLISRTRADIRNVVCTADLKQNIDLKGFVSHGWGIYDSEIYGGRCGYIKPPGMKGKVSIFASGKMISVGANSIQRAKDQLQQAKFCLLKGNFIENVELDIKIQNIVATVNLGKKIKMKKIQNIFQNSSYNPERFPGLIVKQKPKECYLIFSSGKIVLMGMKSEERMEELAEEMHVKLNCVS